MTEDNLLKLLDMVAAKVRRLREGRIDPMDPDESVFPDAFRQVKKLLESLREQPQERCERPYSEELPEDHSDIAWGWHIFCCKNHVHIIHLKYGYIVVDRELAEKILVMGMP